jgi:hypothetical protein
LLFIFLSANALQRIVHRNWAVAIATYFMATFFVDKIGMNNYIDKNNSKENQKPQSDDRTDLQNEREWLYGQGKISERGAVEYSSIGCSPCRASISGRFGY